METNDMDVVELNLNNSAAEERFDDIIQSEENKLVDPLIEKENSGESRDEPKPDMEFDSIDDIFDYYQNINVGLCIDEKLRLTSVFLNHNHVLNTPGKLRYFKKNRKLSSMVKRKLEMNDRAGIRTNKSFNACTVEVGGIENVPFLLKDCYNFVDKSRKLRLGDGDAIAVQNYFLKMQENNAKFFYSMDLDEDGRVKSLFWADARSRAAYEEFGDVITFDTTYLTNKLFPNTRHRWCLWHIMKKLPEKLSWYNEYESIKFSLQNVVYDSLSTTEFESNWSMFIEEKELEKNEWLTLYDESMNAFFDGYVNSKTTLKQFVEQYENALRAKVEKEKLADYSSLNTSLPCASKYKIEKQIQEIYTTRKFMEFQEEIKGKIYCNYSFVQLNSSTELYEVTEDMVGETERQAKFIITFSVDDLDIKCNCRLFEFRRIVCRHCLLVLLNVKKCQALSDKYIFKRWRNDVKRCHIKVKIPYSNWEMNPEYERSDRLCNIFHEVVDLAAESEDKKKFVTNIVQNCIEQLKNGGWKSNVPTSSVPNCLNVGSSGTNVMQTTKENVTPRSPLVVRRKGRLRSTRLQGIVEKAIKKRIRRRRLDIPITQQGEHVDLDISHTITAQSSLHVTQDGGNSVVQGVLFSTSPANIGQEHPQNQGYWSGIYDVISDPNNPRQTISAEWELRNQYFDPFWNPNNQS
ncbi:hypothetical protein OROMI_027715 [Orobanche minor]